MKKFKSIVSKFGIILLITISLTVICFAMSSAKTKTDLINFKKTDAVRDNKILVHFIHGSVPQKNCSYKKQRLGGHLGGHIEIESKGFVYGFLYDTLPINYISKSKFNSKFEKRSVKEWNELVKNDKITTIEIPTSIEESKKLDNLLNIHFSKTPYDYSFFGQRCTSSTAEILSDAGIINKFSNKEAVIAFYYPKLLRRTMLKYADKNKLKVNNKKGIECHDWE